MRFNSALAGVLVVAGMSAAGCHRGVLDGHDPWGAAAQGRVAYNLPPAQRIMEPGPGVGGPGPGVIPPVGGMGGGMGAMYGGGGMYGGMPGGGGMCMTGPMSDGGVMQASYCGPGSGGDGGGYGGYGGGGVAALGGTSQIAFVGGDGVEVSWDVSGSGMFDSVPLVIPGRQDFLQGAIYRLRLSNIPGRPGVELFPTLEVAPVTPRTDAFLAHSPIPVQFTEEDFDQVLSGNFVTKVIYLPDPEFQELALSGVETLVSTRLDPGIDPIAEADRRGSILAIVRIGNKDLRQTAGMASTASRGVVHASYDADGLPMEFPIDEYDEGTYGPMESGPSYPMEYGDGGEGSYGGDGCYDGGGSSGGDGCYDGGGDAGGYSTSGMPMGMPTSGFAPAAVPPHMLAGGPQYGMPITGTPIGLPGPPHIPLGAPAGLQKHVMRNRTRVVVPPPVTKMKYSVKQRPGMNYPRPVNRVTVDEVHREPGGLIPNIWGWINGANAGAGYGGDPNCQ